MIVISALLMLQLSSQAVQDSAGHWGFVVNSVNETDLEARFRDEYPKAFKLLQQPLQNVRYEARRVRDVDYEADTTYYIKGESAQEIMVFDTEKRIKTYPDLRANTYTPQYEFMLGKLLSNEAWYVESVMTGKARTENTDRVRWSRIDRFVAASFLLLRRPVKDVLSDRSFRIIDIKSEQQDGREVVDVTFSTDLWSEYEPLHVKETLDSGKIRVVPSLDWALSQYELRTTVIVNGKTTATETYTGQIHCDRWLDGFVGPKSVRLQNAYEADGAVTNTVDLAEFRTAELGGVDASQFKLSAFGLPDSLLIPLDEDKQRWFQSWLFWAFVTCGVAFWAASFLLRRRKT